MRFNLLVLSEHLLAFFTAVWVLGIGSRKPMILEVSVIGGNIRVPRGLLGYILVRILSLGPCISNVSITDFTDCFGQVLHILGNKTALTFPLGLQYSPVPCSDLGVWHSPEAFDCVDCLGMTGLMGCWGDALSLSKFLASPCLSGSLFMGSGPIAAEPRFPE